MLKMFLWPKEDLTKPLVFEVIHVYHRLLCQILPLISMQCLEYFFVTFLKQNISYKHTNAHRHWTFIK